MTTLKRQRRINPQKRTRFPNKLPKNPKSLHRPDVYHRFIKWMSLPEPEREPRFQKEFAKIYGVGEDTLTNYKKKRGFWDEIQEQWKEWGKDRTSNVMMKFYESIIRKGSTGDFKLWFEYFLDWAERQELTRKGGRPIPILGGKTKKRNSIP